MLKWSSTTVLLLLLLHKNTDYYRPDNLWIMWLARKKKQICWWQRNLWENFIKVRSPVLPDFWISETTKFFRKRSNWSGFGRLLEIFPPPPTCQCAAPRPAWSGPAHLPPASLSPKKQNKKSVLFYKREKKSLLLLTPIFSLISSSSNGYSCYLRNLSPRFYKWYFVTKIVLTYCEKKLF